MTALAVEDARCAVMIQRAKQSGTEVAGNLRPSTRNMGRRFLATSVPDTSDGSGRQTPLPGAQQPPFERRVALSARDQIGHDAPDSGALG